MLLYFWCTPLSLFVLLLLLCYCFLEYVNNGKKQDAIRFRVLLVNNTQKIRKNVNDKWRL